MKNYPEITKNTMHHVKQLKQLIPDLMQKSFELSKLSVAPGVLDAKTKELIALAVGVAARCDGCIGFHTEALVKLDASDQEVAETLGVAISMGGGPSLMTAAEAIESFEQFKKAHNK